MASIVAFFFLNVVVALTDDFNQYLLDVYKRKDKIGWNTFILVSPESHSWKNYAETLSQSFS